MKKYILLILLSFMPFSALADNTQKPIPETTRAQHQALAEYVTARLKAELNSEAYVIENSCTSETDCAITISRSQ